MAHLWMRERDGALGVLSLPADGSDLRRLIRRVAGPTDPGEPDGPAARLVPIAAEPAEWALLAAPDAGISVNGEPLCVGIRVLSDRDEIRIGGHGSVFFTTESLARCEPLPRSDRPFACPRCRQPIEPGTQAVRCPQCSLWHHQSSDLPCWTYSPTCALCPQPTGMDTGFRWTPEEL